MFKGWFKPLSKRDAKFAAVIIGIFLIYGVIDFVKDLIAGMSFEEIKGSIIPVAFGAIIEYGMLVIAFGRSDPAEEEKKEEASEEVVEGIEAIEEIKDSSEEFGEDAAEEAEEGAEDSE